MAILGCAAALLCLPFAFIELGGSKWPGISLGIVLGTLIEIVCYLLLLKGSSFVMSANKKGLFGAVIFNILRMALYVGGLVLGAFCTFVWEGNWINIFSLAIAYLPSTILLIIGKLNEAKEVK